MWVPARLVPQRPAKSSAAIASMVLGIISIPVYVLAFVLGPIAFGLGLSARKDIRESDGNLKGDGMALAGIILGAIGTLIGTIFIATMAALIATAFSGT